MRRAVVNEATDRFRRKGRDLLFESRRSGDGRGQRGVDDDVAERSLVVDALGALPMGQRAVLVLRYYADQSEADTAAALGVSVGTVKSRASRGVAALARALGETDTEEIDV